jgi:hypothetical protein
MLACNMSVENIIFAFHGCTVEEYCQKLLDPAAEVEGNVSSYRWATEVELYYLARLVLRLYLFLIICGIHTPFPFFFRSSGHTVLLLTRLSLGGLGLHSIYEAQDTSTPSDQPNDDAKNHGFQTDGRPSKVLLLVMGIDHRQGSHYNPAFPVKMYFEEIAVNAPLQPESDSSISDRTGGELPVVKDRTRLGVGNLGYSETCALSEQTGAVVISGSITGGVHGGGNIAGYEGARSALVRYSTVNGSGSRFEGQVQLCSNLNAPEKQQREMVLHAIREADHTDNAVARAFEPAEAAAVQGHGTSFHLEKERGQ